MTSTSTPPARGPESCLQGLSVAAIGFAHPHLHLILAEMVDAGASVTVVADADVGVADLAGELWAAEAMTVEQALAAGTDIVATAAPPTERTGVAVRALGRGVDVVVDKPAAITLGDLAELERAVSGSGRTCVVHCSEVVSSRATVAALDAVRRGRIGRLISVESVAPHRVGDPDGRPAWFWDPERSGGILADLGAHQAEQFMRLVAGDAERRGVTPPRAEVAWAAVRTIGELAEPGLTARLDDRLEHHGSVVFAAGEVLGWARLDWWTPDGLPSWGDGRLRIVGTEGTIEVFKHVDPAASPGGDRMVIVDGSGVDVSLHSDEALGWPLALVGRGAEVGFDQERAFAGVALAIEAAAVARRGA